MESTWLELLKSSPTAVGVVIAIILFLRAMKDRDAVFLEALRTINDNNRDDDKLRDAKTDHLFERNIDALAKNATALDENRDTLNEAKVVIYGAKRAS